MAKDGKQRLYTQTQVDRVVEQAVEPLLEKIAELEAKIARLTRDSRTSSKPPSTDVVRPESKGKRGKRKPGGQKGHPKQERELFPPNQVDAVYEYELTDTTGLKPLAGDAGWGVVQQIELIDKPYRITEYRVRRYVDVATGRIVIAPLPKEIRRGGLLGPRLTTFVAYLKGAGHLSYRAIQALFDEVMGLSLSVGLLAKAVGKVTDALAHPYEELLAMLPRQPVLGIDETGHRHRGKHCWTWCMHAPGAPGAPGDALGGGITCFVIDASRGSDVVKELIGEDYAGVVVCDYFSAYRKCLSDMDKLTVQFCWAHLVRDVKFVAEHPDKVTRRYGQKVLSPVRKLFKLLARRTQLTAAGYRRSLDNLRRQVLKAIRGVPSRVEALKIAKRFRKHAASYFTFMDHEGVDPTNNRTEQKIRFVVIDRKITQGTKGEIGWQWCQRIWSTIATCRQRDKSVYQFLLDAINARLGDQPAPSLIDA
ncbi:MAG: IS66 family transposase [Verrucomicrobiota bacterium]|jgi:transposase|nr:IS66 family transposase [Verrucomicrobiota bacterium]HJO28711.1 IS66 family transposase [Candidatus Poseidoniia archaeon]|tara:strand:- start:218 stop:1651 length:1434 start_codon:yes stop_codon:yes gene_type:complete